MELTEGKRRILQMAIENPSAPTNRTIISKAQERGWLDESGRIKDAGGNIGKGESFLRGAAQGVTANFGDELSGALERGLNFLRPANPELKPKSMSELIAENRKQNLEAQKANPKSYLGGEVVGGTVLTSPFAAAAGASKAGTLAKIARGAVEGGAIGGVSAAGEQKNIAGGVATGAALGAAGEVVANIKNIGKAIRQGAEEAGVNAIGFGTPTLRRLRTRRDPLGKAREIARDLMDEKILTRPATVRGVQKKIVSALDDVGENLGVAYSKIDAALPGGVFTKDELASVVKKALSAEDFPDQKAVQAAVSEMDNLLGKFKPDQKMGFKQLWDFVKKIDDKTRMWERASDPVFESGADMLNKAATSIRQSLSDTAENVAPQVWKDVAPLSSLYRNLATAENAISDRIIRAPARGKFLGKGNLVEKAVDLSVGAMPVRTSRIGAQDLLGRVVEAAGTPTGSQAGSLITRALSRGAIPATTRGQ